MEFDQYLNIIRIICYTLISGIFIWKFIHVPKNKFVHLILGIIFGNSVFLSWAILTNNEPELFRIIQTPLVILLLVFSLYYMFRDMKYMKHRKLLDNYNMEGY